MQRHLALLRELFFPPKRRSEELGKRESPEELWDHAKRQIQEEHVRNRERVVQAIETKNQFRNEVDSLKATIQKLDKKADEARKRQDHELADQLLKEKQGYVAALQNTDETLARAEEDCEKLKGAVKQEEERIRQQTAELLALRVQWKESEVERYLKEQLRAIGLEHPSAELNRKTVRELVGFFLLVTIGLLVLVVRFASR
nr:PspA/IM30 family protein [Armatimonas rosea]